MTRARRPAALFALLIAGVVVAGCSEPGALAPPKPSEAEVSKPTPTPRASRTPQQGDSQPETTPKAAQAAPKSREPGKPPPTVEFPLIELGALEPVPVAGDAIDSAQSFTVFTFCPGPAAVRNGKSEDASVTNCEEGAAGDGVITEVQIEYGVPGAQAERWAVLSDDPELPGLLRVGQGMAPTESQWVEGRGVAQFADAYSLWVSCPPGGATIAVNGETTSCTEYEPVEFNDVDLRKGPPEITFDGARPEIVWLTAPR